MRQSKPYADGSIHPTGEECHACFAPRRKAFFVEEKVVDNRTGKETGETKTRMSTLDELKESRKDAAVNDVFMKYREEFVQTG